MLAHDQLAIGDLIRTEVLQSFDADLEFKRVARMLDALMMIEIGGKEIAIQAARNVRLLRMAGVTPRKTIDTLIATRCIESGLHLLHNDLDFDVFAEHLGTQVVA